MTTPRDVETARAIANKITLLVSTSYHTPVSVDRDDATRRIAAALSERERETTERCAVIAESMADGWFTELAKEIAAAIRADAARRESE